ncbi:epiplakin-like [Heteronotia binoei]|uniref:epiplakin-like n=1 Tax=Heteronotia binoei TaxID=13085 RepID=UPI002930F386|nr:epiplakin-like [Heteronotia binoei]
MHTHVPFLKGAEGSFACVSRAQSSSPTTMEPRESASENQCHPPALPADPVGPDIQSITGVYVEASARTMGLYEALQEHFLQPDLALALLEAQAATGGIIDWRSKRLLSVAEALRMELVGLEMKERLLSAERARTGFVDPYTEETVSLYQAIQKELIGKEQGLSLLGAQIATGGIIEPTTGRRVSLREACELGYLGEELSSFLCDPGNEAAKGFWDPNSSQKVTYRELRRRCIADPASGLLLLPLKISFPGLRGRVCSHELLDSGIIDSALFKALHNGEITAQEVAEMDSVQRFLSGTGSIAGVAVLEANACRSIYQALTEHLLVPGTALTLLQAQAATGCLTDPVKNEKFTADTAVQAGVVGPELHEKLSAAERAVTGYKDPYSGETVSLFQAFQKGLVPRDPAIFLLDAQLATGGIVDPHTHHRLPVEVACQRGLLDRDTHALLCSPTDGTRGFFEPNSKETLSYAELLLRCVTDPETELYLLPLSGDPRGAHSFIDHGTRVALENTEVPVVCGKFKGKQMSLWKLLFSDYFTGKQRRSLIQQFRSGGLSTQELADVICDNIRQGAAHSAVTFEGLREKVTPAQLLSSKIINQDLFEKLTQGEASAKDVVGMGTVRKYLEGTGSISGLILPDSEERIGIYQAKRKGFLRPGTSLILLEAQAATGYLIDPAANKKYSVDEALRANLIGPEVYDKLLAAEKAVTGYTDPYTGHKISLFQAMMKDLIVKEHAIRLLEAQIATGGIIDPVNSHRLPVEAAYQRGYFDKKMNLILSDPSDDTKGFFDPNTHENLTYLQLKEKCVTESSTGLCLLPLNSRKRQFIDDATKQAFRSSWLLVKYGRFRGQRVSVWDLLNSEYFSEGKRREMFSHYHLRKVTLEQIKLMLQEEMKKWARITFPAMRGHVTAYHLMESGILGRDLFERLLEGALSPEEVLRMDSVRKYLYGTGSIGGIVLQPSKEKVGLYEAMKRNIVLPGVVLPLLEAQAATGFLLDPVSSQKVCLDEAVKGGLVGPELYDKLQRAEAAVTGYKDPFTGEKVSLFQAMKKGLVPDKEAIRLLDAQLSTGGVIDPHRAHYVPVEFAQKRGYLDESLTSRLSHPNSDTKTFCSPDSKENVTYSQLIDRCQQDEGSGFRLLPLSETASLVCTDEQMERLFRETLVEEKGLSLWELLHSGYFTEEQRRDFFEKFRSEAISLQQLIHLVLRLIKEMEMKAQAQVTFQGLRGTVPAVWLLDNGILSEKVFTELVQGRKRPEQVAEMESVKQYLQGTGSIVGVFLPASKEKMSIYQAMQKNLLMPGMGARLLEAQAATGSLVDLGSNQRLGVEEATRTGVVGKELTEQLLQAERALTGYRDPYSGRLISVCQAIRKELVPAAAGIPLLEAQLASGGVIDPIHHHHLPLHSAYKHGFYDEDMHRCLSQPTEDSCVFFDPNTQDSLTYQQLKERCIRDPLTGLLLLPLSEDAAFYGDTQIMEVLKSETVCVSAGRFKGRVVSLWDLLNSEYISKSKRRELLMTYKEGAAEALQEIITAITTAIGETEMQGKRFTFRGLRKQVSASDLFQAELIDKGTLDELHQGKKTVQEVTEMDSVRRFLEGCNFIAGVLLQPTCEKMSIYQAMRQGLLRPGMALVLLEAQAATGFLIDPVKNKKLSVDEGMATGLIGREIYEKLLSAERAVTGYTHPYTKGQISLFEAMNEELIVRSHGIRLLEAQIATGGIIDPVHSHRIPVEVAYKRGYFDEKMNQVLSDPTDDTKGFFDPNTHENLTYLQLLERCVQDAETGLYMLQIVRRGERYFYIDETTKQFLQTQLIQMHVGKYKGQAVSIWDLLCSPYIQEQRRKDLVRQYKCEMLTLERLISIITTAIEETEHRTQKLKVKGLRGEVSAAELFNADIIDKKTLDGLHQGAHALNQLIQKDSVKRYLEGTGCIAGVSVASKKMTIYEAVKMGLLSPENGLVLLEAQAATGFITDPLKKKTFSVDQAVSARVVGDEIHEKLVFAEKAVTGYTDPATGNKLSLFQAMKKSIVERAYALRLLEAQLATGGIMDPKSGHRVPVEVAYKRGCLDEDTLVLLSDPEYGIKGFVDPNTHKRITYAHLLQRCAKDKDTGLHLLQLLNKSEYFYVDDTTKNILSSTKVNVKLGKYAGQTLSVWELLCSDYINEEKRKELIKKYKQGSSVILQHITNEILDIIDEKERNRRDIWFQGLRQQVTASELFKADIISQDTIKKLEEGRQTVQEVANMDSVRRYLEGTSCIAGVLVPSKKDPSKMQQMTIYEAMWKGILRPGTALVLLEAQAATGFIVDPLKNERLSVDDAISTGLVGGEIHSKLLAAEKAVTGYTDPYTGKRISLFQAMKKDLIIKEHGIRLLEAQIATGGIIDPVNSHRIPIEVAYKRGYFDEHMNQVLSDPTDDTKGFFDPNTHENLTYMQLLKRCTCDPDTGLFMLQINNKGFGVFDSEENIRKTLKSTKVKVSLGQFQDQNVSLWDILYSTYISQYKRQQLLEEYKNGKIMLKEITTILKSILEEIELRGSYHIQNMSNLNEEEKISNKEYNNTLQNNEDWKTTLQRATMTVKEEGLPDKRLSVWDTVFSMTIPEHKREELLSNYRKGKLTMEKLKEILASLHAETTSRVAICPSAPDPHRPAMASFAEEEDAAAAEENGREMALKTRMVEIRVGEFRGQKVSIWDLLHSKYIPEEKRKEILHLYKTGILTIDQMETVVTGIVNGTEEEKMKEAASPTAASSSWEDPLRNHTVVLHVSEFQGQEASLWDLIFSQSIPDSKREELLTKYRSGLLDIPDMIATLIPILTGREGSHIQDAGSSLASRKLLQEGRTALPMNDQELEQALRMMTTDVPVGEFQCYKCSIWELLFSKYVTVEQRQELLQRYRVGAISAEELVQLIIALIEETEERSNTLKFPGLRREVTASELFNSQIIDQDTLSDLTRGAKSVVEITEMDSVKRYLEGTSCIAGVLVPSKKDPSKMQQMTIYEAMWKGILRPGTALVLLEAQAATGFIVDPLKNEKLSVDDAVSAGLVGAELQEKLLSAEKAVTGYNDPYTGNKISLFQAMNKGLIVKDHGIRLLEAQIATGGIIDPVHSHRLPVEMAYKRGYFDEEMNQILSDPTDDTKGFFDPNTHENLTYMQLRLRCIPDPDTGLLMLHLMEKGSLFFALNDNTRKSLQSAKTTLDVGMFQGQQVSVWDLLFSGYIPPNKRQELLRQYKAGTITIQDIIQILTAIVTETEERNTRNTQSRKQPPSPPQREALCPDAAHPSQEETWEKTLKNTVITLPAGDHQGQQVSVWDLLFSCYITEEKRTELLELYRRGMLPMDRLISILTTLVVKKESTKRKLDIKVRSPAQESAADKEDDISSPSGTGNWETSLQSHHIQVPLGELQHQQLSLWDALYSRFIPDNKREELLSDFRKGKLTLEILTEIFASLYAATTTRMAICPSASDPHHPAMASFAEEEDAAAAEEDERETALKTRMVEIRVGEFRGQKVSIWDLLHSKYIPEEKRKEILHLYKTGILTIDQMETVVAGIVNGTEEEKMKEAASPSAAPSSFWEDPLRNHTVVLHVGEFQGQEASLWDLLFSQYIPDSKREELLKKYQSGLLEIPDMIATLIPILTGREGSHNQDAGSGLASETKLSQAGGTALPPMQDQELEQALRMMMTDVPVGEFQGYKCSIWELLFSKYVTVEQRQELLQRYRVGAISAEELVQLIIALIEETEERINTLKFPGLRREVTASELFNSQIIDQDTLSDLTRGAKSVVEITEMDSVKRYLEGTSCIAGVLVPSKKDPSKMQQMTIYEAMWKGILRPGTALVLLEAQAATGFIVDPLKNEKLSVDDAVSAGLVGAELQEKLLSAEKAVTGYNDPYTGNKISLFQAMNKGLIVKDHGIRLLEAQIATGGIIDPVHSHRLPVEMAYKRGYFDEEMNQILSDPTDDTKGFFDPNTHENLTYMQLRLRCIPDPDTGLLMLHLMEKGSLFFALNDNTRKSLQSAKTTLDVGMFQGQQVSVWDLLFSGYIPPNKRQELLRQYKAGTITIQDIIQILTAIVTETEERNTRNTQSRKQPPSPPQREALCPDAAHPSQEETWEKTLKNTVITLPAGDHQGQQVSVWDLLFSSYITEEKRTELLELYRRGMLPMDRLISILTTLVVKKESTKRKLDIKVRSPAQESAADKEDDISSPSGTGNWETSLQSHHIQVPLGELQHQQLSLWDALYSRFIPDNKREELLSDFRKGKLTLEMLTEIFASLYAATTTRMAICPSASDPHRPAMASFAEEEDAAAAEEDERETALKTRMVEIRVGEFRGQKVSIWDLLHSKYIPEEKRKEILHLYKTGILTIDQMKTVVAGIVNGTEEEKMKEAASPSAAPSSFWEDPLRNHTVVLHVGEFQGQEASLWDLLFSQYIPDSKREELLKKYQSGLLDIPDMIATLIPILTGREGSHNQDAGSGLASETKLSQAGGTALPPMQDQELEQALRMMTTDVPVGEFQGYKCSIWELLFSKYVTVEQRQELLQRYRVGAISAEELVQLIIALIEETEERSNTLKFPGLRREVTASELFNSQIIDQDTLSDLTRGAKSVVEITEMDSVKRYLEGTSCIAGVLVPSKKDPSKMQQMTIYEAMWKGILRPGTALVLLEAQAATGFIVDPLKNEKLSVDDAVSAGLVGAELQEKLLSAEKAVTGYNDPYTGNKISLFQAMNKGLIVKDHGIRLLEAQIATGGIIDPVHSHRLPVEMAYKRGYFDEEMNQILSDPTDDTKGFFDPNTHENLTYMQLRLRCIPDPDTGLLMLHLMEKGSLFFALNDNTRKSLQSAKTTLDVGMFQGQQVSVWDLLFSGYIPPNKRQELLRQYKAGTITIQDIIQILTAIVTETEERNTRNTQSRKQPPSPPQREALCPDAAHPSQEETWEKTLKNTVITLPAGDHQGQQVSVWDLLFSSYITEEKRTELLELYRRGMLPMDRLISILTTLVVKKESTKRKLDIKVRSPAQESAADKEDDISSPSGTENWETSLQSHHIQVPLGELQCQQLSLWDALYSRFIPDNKREELLSDFRNGKLNLEKLTEILASLHAETTSRVAICPSAPDPCHPAMASFAEQEEEADSDAAEENEREKALKARTVEIHVGEFRGQKVSIWDLLHSKYIPEEKRKEILHLYKTGILTIDQMETVVAGIVNGTEEEKMKETASDSGDKEETSADAPEEDKTEMALKARKVEISVGEFRGQTVSIWDLLHSRYIPEEKRKEILHLYKTGILTIDQMETVVAGIVNGTEEEKMKETASDSGDKEETSADAPEEDKTEMALKARKVEISVGEFRGQTVSIWDLLHSRYIPEEKRKEILHLYKTGILTIDQMETVVTGIVNRTEEEKMKEAAYPSEDKEEGKDADSPEEDETEMALKARKVEISIGEFRGQKVSIWDLLHSKYIPEEKRKEILHFYKTGILTIDQLETVVTGIVNRTEEEKLKEAVSDPGEKGGKDVDAPEEDETEMALKVRKVEISVGEFRGQKVSIWDLLHSKYIPEEKRKEILHLYKTGILTIDQMETVVAGIVNRTEEEKLKEAVSHSGDKEEKDADAPEENKTEMALKARKVEISVGEFRGQKVSIWDLLHSKYIPEEKRKEILHFYKTGILTIDQLETVVTGIVNRTEVEKLKEAVSDPGEKGEKDVDAPEEDETEMALKARKVEISVGEFRGQKVSIWDLLHSKYIPEEKRKEILHLYKTGILTIDQMETVVAGIVNRTEEEKLKEAVSHSGDKEEKDADAPEENKTEMALKARKVEISVGEFRGQKVSIWDLLHSKYIPEEKRKEILHFYKTGILTIDQLETVVTGIVNRTEEEKLKEAVSDPGEKGEKDVDALEEDETEMALKARKVEISVGEFRGQKVSIWDLLHSKYIPEEKRKEILHLYKTGILTTDQMETVVTGIVNRTEEEKLKEAVSHSGDKEEKDADAPEENKTEMALKARKVEISVGEFRGQKVSIWDLLHSKYIPEEKRKEILHLYKTGILTIDQMETVVTGIVNRTEEEKMKKAASPSEDKEEEKDADAPEENETEMALKARKVEISVGEFRGQKVSIWDLLHSKYIPEEKRNEILHLYKSGILTTDQMETVVTGIVNRTEEEKLKEAISDSGDKGEKDADAPEEDETEMALKARKVEISVGEFRGQKVSIWDLLHSKYIPEEKRKEILHLYKTGILTIDQMETVVTGIVNRTEEEKMKEASSSVDCDPVVSVEGESVQSSYYDLLQHTLRLENIDVTIREIQGQKSSVWDPFFSQFVSNIRREEVVHRHGAPTVSVKESRRSITTLITQTENRPFAVGHSAKGDVVSPDIFTASASQRQTETENALKSRMLKGSFGEVFDQQVSLWDACHCEHIPEEKRRDLLNLFKTGMLTIDQLETIITTTLNKTVEKENRREGSHPDLHSEPWEDTLHHHSVVLHAGQFQGWETSLWDLLFSQYIPENKRGELLISYRNGSLSLEELKKILASLFAETASGVSEQPKTPDIPRPPTASFEEEEGKGADAAERDETEMALKARKTEISVGEFCGQKVSIWDLLHSRYIPEEKRKEILHLYKTGILTIDQMETVVTGIVNETEEENTEKSGLVSNQPQERKQFTKSPNVSFGHSLSLEKMLRSEIGVGPVGDFQGRMVSCWDLLFSRYISEEKRQELLTKFKENILSAQELTDTLTNIITEAETHRQVSRPSRSQLSAPDKSDDLYAQQQQQLKKSLRTTLVPVSSGQFKGQKVCVLDLLFSKYVSQDRRQELLEQYRAGTLPIQDMVTAIITMIEEAERKPGKVDVKRKMSSKKRTVSWAEKGAADSQGLRLVEHKRICGQWGLQTLGASRGRCSPAQNPSRASSSSSSPGTTEPPEPGARRGRQQQGEGEAVAASGAAAALGPPQGSRQEARPALVFVPLGASDPAEPPPSLQRAPPALTPRRAPTKQCRRFFRVDPWRELLRLLRVRAAAGPRGLACVCPRRGCSPPPPGPCAQPPHDPREREGGGSGRRPCGRQRALPPPSALQESRFGCLKEAAAVLPPGAAAAAPGPTGRGSGGDKKRGEPASRGAALPSVPPGASAVPSTIAGPALPCLPETPELPAPVGSTPRTHPSRAICICTSTAAMSQTKQGTKGGTEEMPIVQVREEAQWPFPCPPELGEEPIIAGVLKEPSKEKLSIQKAMRKGLLARGTGLVLLEAQAVSGFILDPVKNRRLSVRDATNAGLVDREYFNTLLVAEKAVTGYTDPFSGNKISLFQAMKRGLLVKDHGIRLLEAQVATGGIIHPMHSHRLPVELAYKWGYLDGDICHLIADPAKHTKRCFDPIARENLTYVQLLHRCVPDPETGLLMVPIMDKGSIVSKLDKSTQKSLQAATTKVHVGLFQGQEVSVWDLLFSRYVPLPKKQELLKQYKAGSITLQDIISVLDCIISEAEAHSEAEAPRRGSFRGKEEGPSQEMELRSASEQEGLEKPLKSRMVTVSAGEFRGRKVSVWDLLHSKYIPEEKQKELLKLYKSGVLNTDQMDVVVTAIVTKIEEVRAKELGHVAGAGREMETIDEADIFDPQEEDLKTTLQSIGIPVTLGEFKGQNVPLLDIISSRYFPQDKREELLRLFRTGTFSMEQMTRTVGGILEKLEASRKRLIVKVIGQSQGAPGGREGPVAADAPASKHLDDVLKSKMVTLPAGELKGQQVSLWDLLFSHYVARDKREELLKKYRDGMFSADELSLVLIILASLHEFFDSLECTTPRTSRNTRVPAEPAPAAATFEEDEDEENDDDDDDDDKEDQDKDKALKSRMVSVSVSEFRGRKVSLWDLLHSKYVPEKKRKEILKLYRIGILSTDQMETVITAIVTRVAEKMAATGRHVSASSPDIRSGGSRPAHEKPRGKTVDILTIDFPVGEFQGRRVSMWDLLFSRYVSEAKRQELLARYITGTLSSQEILAILTTLIMETHKLRRTSSLHHPLTTWLPEALGLSQAQGASLPDLHCPLLPEEHRAPGMVTVSEITVTTTVISGPEQKQG